MPPDFSGLAAFVATIVFVALLTPGLAIGLVMSMLGFKALTAIPVFASAILAGIVASKIARS